MKVLLMVLGDLIHCSCFLIFKINVGSNHQKGASELAKVWEVSITNLNTIAQMLGMFTAEALLIFLFS